MVLILAHFDFLQSSKAIIFTLWSLLSFQVLSTFILLLSS
jgi:hypothetical protein